MQFLIFEERDAWQVAFHEALGQLAELRFVQNYQEALSTLSSQVYDLAVVDVWLDTSLNESDPGGNGSHDGLEAAIHIAARYPNIRLLVISDDDGREALQNTPGLPAGTPFLTRREGQAAPDRASIGRLILDILSRQPVETLGESPVGLEVTAPLINSRAGKPRVLIVEDQPFWLNTLANVLEQAGVFWRIATGPAQALARLRLESFHVVLFNLPLREAAWQMLDFMVMHCQSTKLIIVSGQFTSAEVARLFMGYPVRGFIDKSTFSEAQLITTVRSQIAIPALRIQTLGDFRVWRAGRLINDFGSPYAEAVIKLLLTRRGQPISSDEMIRNLWPEDLPDDGRPDQAQQSKLVQAINAARVAMETDLPRPGDSHMILRDGTNFRFDLSANVEIDAEQLQALVVSGHRHERRGENAAALRNYEQVRELYLGDYLPADRGEPWTVQERTALQALYSEALNHMADLYAGQGRLDDAIETAENSLQVDAYDEGTYRRLMRYHACKGEKGAALAAYRSLVKLFSEFFGEEPHPKTRRLRDEIMADQPVDCVEITSATGEWRIPATG